VRYLLTGMAFGVLLYKSEVISWYRIQEMFRFQSFHLFGVIGSAVVVGAISVALLRRRNARTLAGDPIDVPPKPDHRGTWIGGSIFGMGWALTGACPGPLYAHVGAGTSVMLVALLSAIVGTWVYSYSRPKLPH
jgi:uncharacterized membrane protein YedE/YeeE